MLILLFVSVRVFLSRQDDSQPNRQNWQNEKYIHQVTYSCTSLVLVEDAGEIDCLYHHNTLIVYLTTFMRLPVLSHWLLPLSSYMSIYPHIACIILYRLYCILILPVSSHWLRVNCNDSCPSLRILILSLYHAIK